MSDALVFTLPLEGGEYASQNAIGKDSFRGGRKSKIYKFVFNNVKDLAEKEMARVNWGPPATCECDVTIYRFIPKRWRTDAINMGTAEFNALTAAGVWADDRLGNPARCVLRYDAPGPHRIVVVVVKLYEPANRYEPTPEQNANELTRRSRASTGRGARSTAVRDRAIRDEAKREGAKEWRPGDPIPAGFADYNGRLIPEAEALAYIRGEKKPPR